MTVSWLRQALDCLARMDRLWLDIPIFGLAAAALGCNIAVWEYGGDQALVPYRFDHSNGLFLVSPEAGYVRIVYCAYSEWYEGSAPTAPSVER